MTDSGEGSFSRASIDGKLEDYDSEIAQRGHVILGFSYQRAKDHSPITMLDLAADCGLDETVPIGVEEVVDGEWITETWALSDASDEASLAAAQDVYAEFLTQVKILADRGFAKIHFELPEGEAGDNYFYFPPPPPSVQ
jgi:hypothetical protein